MILPSSRLSPETGLQKGWRSLREEFLRVISAKERSHRLSALLHVSAQLPLIKLI
jgi:hypothetical protein